jgi:hypothetical protein
LTALLQRDAVSAAASLTLSKPFWPHGLRPENSVSRQQRLWFEETRFEWNLPPDEPGIVFVKVPQSWLDTENVRHELVHVAHDFLRQTQRIVLIVLYVSAQFFNKEHELMVSRHLVEEVQNSTHRFDQTKDWRLFRGFVVPREWNGMPPKWHRIFSRGSDDAAYSAIS